MAKIKSPGEVLLMSRLYTPNQSWTRLRNAKCALRNVKALNFASFSVEYVSGQKNSFHKDRRIELSTESGRDQVAIDIQSRDRRYVNPVATALGTDSTP